MGRDCNWRAVNVSISLITRIILFRVYYYTQDPNMALLSDMCKTTVLIGTFGTSLACFLFNVGSDASTMGNCSIIMHPNQSVQFTSIHFNLIAWFRKYRLASSNGEGLIHSASTFVTWSLRWGKSSTSRR